MRLVAALNQCGEFLKSLNIQADRIEKDENFYIAYDGSQIVGAFDIGVVLAIYLTGNPSDHRN